MAVFLLWLNDKLLAYDECKQVYLTVQVKGLTPCPPPIPPGIPSSIVQQHQNAPSAVP